MAAFRLNKDFKLQRVRAEWLILLSVSLYEVDFWPFLRLHVGFRDPTKNEIQRSKKDQASAKFEETLEGNAGCSSTAKIRIRRVRSILQEQTD